MEEETFFFSLSFTQSLMQKYCPSSCYSCTQRVSLLFLLVSMTFPSCSFDILFCTPGSYTSILLQTPHSCRETDKKILCLLQWKANMKDRSWKKREKEIHRHRQWMKHLHRQKKVDVPAFYSCVRCFSSSLFFMLSLVPVKSIDLYFPFPWLHPMLQLPPLFSPLLLSVRKRENGIKKVSQSWLKRKTNLLWCCLGFSGSHTEVVVFGLWWTRKRGKEDETKRESQTERHTQTNRKE